MINRWTGTGRICKSIELRYTPSGVAVATIRIAVDNGQKPDGSKDTLFIDCIAWKKTAETAANNLDVGRLIGVEGKLKSRSWEKDGVTREKMEVHIDSFGLHFLDRAPDAGGERPAGAPKRQASGGGGGIGSELAFNDDDDVPF